MKHYKLKFAAALIGALGLVTAPALVYAHDGLSGRGSDSQASAQTTTDSSPGADAATTEAQNPAAQTDGIQTEQTDTAKAQTEGRDFLATLQNKLSKHSDVNRRKNCQAAQKGLETKLTNMQKNAASFESKIDTIYQKALAYQTANNLNPTGIDQLEATANAAKTTASASVASLSSLSVNLDCTSTSVATNVATFRAAAKQARTDLMSYKTAVKDVLTALEGAKTNG